MIQGTCLCGTLRYEIDGRDVDDELPLLDVRKQHGAAFATYAVAPLAGFRWIAGRGRGRSLPVSAQGSRGSAALRSVAPGRFVAWASCSRPGNLGGTCAAPRGHMFVGSKAPWHAITDHLPQHEVYPPGFPAEGVPRPQAAPRQGVTDGSCLCGEVPTRSAGNRCG